MGGAWSDAVTYALEERDGEQVLVVTPDRGWLEDPARVWPVRVDPTTVDRTTLEDTYVKSTVTADRSGALELRAGIEGGLLTAAYMKFLLSIPANSFVSAATLHAHNSYSAGGCTPKPVGVYRVTQTWGASTMTTWPGAPYDATPVDVRSFAHGGGPSCPSNWVAWDVRSLVTGWLRGSYPNHGITLRVPSGSSNDAGAGKRFTSMEGSTQDAIIRVTWSPWGAQYNPGSSWTNGQAATNNTTGKWPIQIRNVGSTTWVAGSDVKLGTRVYLPSQNGTGTPVAQHRTTLPHNVSPQQLFGMDANVPPLPPGTYHVFFEMVKEGDFWFSAEDPWNPRLGIAVQIVNQVPRFVSNAPDSGDTVNTRRPLLSVVGEDPDDYGLIIEYFFRICPGPNRPPSFPSAVTGCQSSGWQAANSWTPPNALPRWNEGAYWWAFIRDRTGPEPRFAEPVLIVPTPPQTKWAKLGRANATATDGGVDVRTGHFSSSVTDLSVGWGSSSFAITRTYNSGAYTADSTMGRGWSSILDVRIDTPLASATPESFTLYRDDGRRETWARDTIVPGSGEEVYRGPLGSSETLTWDTAATRFVWRHVDRTEYWFNIGGYLTRIVRPGLPDITVERSSPLSPQIQAFHVGTTTVSVDWASGRVASIRTTGPGSDARWRYTYSGFLLTDVCDPRPTGERGCHTYQYQDFPAYIHGTPHGPLSVARNNGQLYLQLQHEIDQDPRVQWRRDGEAHQWSYAYSTYTCPGPGTSTTSCRRATVTQPNPTGLLYPGSAQPLPLQFDFDRFEHLVKRTNERGHFAEWEYDALGFVYHEIDENKLSRIFWRSGGHLTAVTEIREVHPTNPVYSTTAFEYPTGLAQSDPRWGLPIWIFDPRVSTGERDISEATWLRYDTKGRLLQRRSPSAGPYVGRSEHFTYVPVGQTGEGQLQTSTDHVGRVTTNHYANGRVSEVVAPTGLRTELTYTAEGRIASTKRISDAHPAGVTTTMHYDEIGQLVRVVGPPATNVIDAVSRQHVVELTYDPSRRLVAQTEVGSGAEPDRTTQWTGFDGNGRPTEIIDPEGRVTATEWTWRGQIRTVASGNGLRVTHQYARTGQVARILETDLVESPNQDVLLRAFSYDQAGRLGTEVDARGAWFDYTYWDDGRPRRTTLTNYKATPAATPQTRILSDVTYDLAGNPIIEFTRNMTSVTARTYDLTNALRREETAGRYVSYEHRADGLLDSMTVGDANHADVTQYGYTALPDVQPSYTAQHRGQGQPTYIVGFEHDDRGLLVGVTEPNNRRTDMDYDALGRLVRTTGPPVSVEGYGAATGAARAVGEIGYNTFSEVIQQQAPDGTTRTSNYDRLGRPLTLALPPYSPEAGVSLTPSVSYAYDDTGRTRTSTDDLRGTTSIERFDHRGRVVEVEDPPLSGSGPGSVTFYGRNAAGDIVAAMGPQGQVEEYTHDNTGRVTRSRQVERYGTPGTFETSFVYDSEFDLVQTTAPDRAPVLITHNTFGEQTSVQTAPAGSGSHIRTTFSRDHMGRVVRMADNAGRSHENIYDQLGLLTQTRTYNGTTLLRWDDYAYGANLDLEAVTRPGPNPGSGRVATTYQHDAMGRLTSMTEPGGLTTSHGYDANGRRVRSTDGNGNATWFTYTPWGDLESVIDPATTAHPDLADRTWHSTYEAPGMASRTTAPGGVVIDFGYDAHSNPVSASGTGGDGPASETLEWDASGRLIEASSAAGTTTLTWDDRGNVLETSGAGGASSMRYDGTGLMTSRTDAGATSTFTYWSNGLLKAATGSRTGVTEQYSYDSTGALQTLTYPSGTTRTFTYDGFGNPASDTLKTGASTVATQSWTFGPDGEHVASTTAGPAPLAGSGIESYTYDGAGRLSTTTRPGSTVTTTWDAAGNRVANGATTATFDERNRLLTSGPPGAIDTYEWTPRGTLDSVTSASGTTDYQFDAFDRLVREVGPGVDDEYGWDALDRLAMIDGAPMSYAGMERDPVAVPGQLFERGPDGAARAFAPTGGTARFVRSNHRGDANATFVPGATAATSSRAYTPFGVPTSAGSPQPSFGFQGDWTSESGLVHMDARFYDPSTGSFISRDTWHVTGTVADANRYTYGAANPVTNNDPTGHARPGSCHGEATDPLVARSLPISRGFDHCDRPRPPQSIGPTKPSPSVGSPGPSGPARPRPSALPANEPQRAPNRPSTPNRPPRPVRPDWTTIVPTVAMPEGHLVPPASASRPIIDSSLTLLHDPTNVPVASYMPETSSTPYTATLLGGGSWGGDGGGGGGGGGSWSAEDPGCDYVQREDGTLIRDKDGDPIRLFCGDVANGIVLPPYQAAECLLQRILGDHDEDEILQACTNPSVPPWILPPQSERDHGRGGALGDIAREILEPACSFSADTAVLMADGTTKAISEIVIGDWVIAIDPETGARGAQQVTDVWVHEDQLLDLRVGGEVLTTTEDHPFWNETDRTWQPADELDPGDLLVGSDGSTVAVAGLLDGTVRTDAAYNLSVDAIRAYVVVVDGIEILVHNVDPRCRINGRLAGGKHPGTNVPFDEDGFPDFSAWRHPDVPDLVPIVPSRTRATDARRANKKVGFAKTPAGYVWHHHQQSGMMQLIEEEVHGETNHTGGFSIWGGDSPNFRPGGR